MRVGLTVAAAAAALVAAAPASAATGTYAGTVTNTQGKIALDVKINRAGFVKKIKEIRVKDVPSNCETSGPGVAVDHVLPTSLPVRDNGKFEGFFQQPVYNNVSSIGGRLKHKHMRGGFRIDYHYPAEEPYPEENCDTGPLNFTAKFGAPDATLTPPAKLGR